MTSTEWSIKEDYMNERITQLEALYQLFSYRKMHKADDDFQSAFDEVLSWVAERYA